MSMEVEAYDAYLHKSTINNKFNTVDRDAGLYQEKSEGATVEQNLSYLCDIRRDDRLPSTCGRRPENLKLFIRGKPRM